MSERGKVWHAVGDLEQEDTIMVPNRVFERAAFDYITEQRTPSLAGLVEHCQMYRSSFLRAEQMMLEAQLDAAYDARAVPPPSVLEFKVRDLEGGG